LAARGRGRDRRSLEAARSLSRVDACNPLLQAHPTWARDEHEGHGIPPSLTPVFGRLALPPSRSPSRSTHLGWGTRRHSLVAPGTLWSRNTDSIRVQLVDEDIIGLANDLLWYQDSYNPLYSRDTYMVFMSTQVKHHTSICHIISQNKMKTMENSAKLRESFVQT
jgi:hypothetical protein